MSIAKKLMTTVSLGAAVAVAALTVNAFAIGAPAPVQAAQHTTTTLNGAVSDIATPPVPSGTSGQALAHPAKPWIGVYLANPLKQLRPYKKLTKTTVAGTAPNLVMFFKNFAGQTTFNATEYNKVHDAGATPIIAWEPWNPGGDPVYQPKYALKNITAGKFDTLIATWADGVKALKYPVMIRFAHEMNGHWYPWASTVNGNSAADYVAAWRHLHDIFTAHGVTNAAWVWSPNVNRFLSRVPLKPLYPGDDYVDIVGMVGYGTQKGETFNTTFGSTIKAIRVFTNKPLLITETGAAEKPSNKAKWTASLFTALTKRHDIIGFVWFNQTKREAWRVNTTPASLRAYKRGVAAYVKGWTPQK
jgi:hypothetical protein